MKMKIAFAAAFAFMAGIVPGYGQNTEDVMQPLDLREPGIYSNPAVEMWKDLLDKANAERKGNPGASGELVPGYVFAKEFKDGDTTVLASIYRAWDTECDNGPNTMAGTADWATCPVRVKVTQGGRSRIVEDTVCATTTAITDGANAPDDKNYAAFIPNVGIQFNVASKGRYTRECTKLVRLGKTGTTPSKPAAVAEASPPPMESGAKEYSDTKGRTCRQIVEEAEYSHWSCSAPAGRRVHFMDTGSVAAVRFGETTNVNHEPGYIASGEMVGKKIEWRLRDGKPFAGILRFLTRGANDRASQVLVVTKVNGKEACRIAYINAGLKDANQKAVEIAETTAHTFKCGTDRAVRIGNPQIRLESDT